MDVRYFTQFIDRWRHVLPMKARMIDSVDVIRLMQRVQELEKQEIASCLTKPPRSLVI